MHRTSYPTVAAAIAVALALTACGAGSSAAPTTTIGADAAPAPSTTTPITIAPAPDEPAAPGTSRWDRLLDRTGDDGEITVDMAVDAFSLAVAPLPGASVEPDASDPPIHDATLAVSWALRHFDELTPDQQAAVGRALSPAEGRAGFRAGAAPKIGCYGQVVATGDSPDAGPIRQVADGLITELEGRLAGAITLVAPTYILLDHRDLGLGTAYTWADPGDCDENAMATCTIHLSAKAEASDPTTLRGILAHELMHCFQFQYLGVAAYEMPDWILEGAPAWVGEDIAGGTPISTPWWTKYLTTPERSLYSRSYDAIGFYAHLDEIGIDPWTRFTAIYDGFSFEPAWEAAGASSGSFLESWPSSTLRRTDIGRAWDATGPGITIDRATPKPLASARARRRRRRSARSAAVSTDWRSMPSWSPSSSPVRPGSAPRAASIGCSSRARRSAPSRVVARARPGPDRSFRRSPPTRSSA